MTCQTTPNKVVFGRDILLDVRFAADRKAIQLLKHKMCNNINRKSICPTKGPYPIVQVYINSTDHVKNGTFTEHITNIRYYTPCID